MKIKVALVQIATLIVFLIVGFTGWNLISKNRIYISVINKTGSNISRPALKYDLQHCSTSSLANDEYLICSFVENAGKGMMFIGRAEDKPYTIGKFKGLKSGDSFRNVIELMPNMEYELHTKQVIL